MIFGWFDGLVLGAFIGASVIYYREKHRTIKALIRAADPDATILGEPSFMNDCYVAFVESGYMVYEFCTVQESLNFQQLLDSKGVPNTHGPASCPPLYRSATDFITDHCRLTGEDVSKWLPRPTSSEPELAPEVGQEPQEIYCVMRGTSTQTWLITPLNKVISDQEVMHIGAFEECHSYYEYFNAGIEPDLIPHILEAEFKKNRTGEDISTPLPEQKTYNPTNSPHEQTESERARRFAERLARPLSEERKARNAERRQQSPVPWHIQGSEPLVALWKSGDKLPDWSEHPEMYPHLTPTQLDQLEADSKALADEIMGQTPEK